MKVTKEKTEELRRVLLFKGVDLCFRKIEESGETLGVGGDLCYGPNIYLFIFELFWFLRQNWKKQTLLGGSC